MLCSDSPADGPGTYLIETTNKEADARSLTPMKQMSRISICSFDLTLLIF